MGTFSNILNLAFQLQSDLNAIKTIYKKGSPILKTWVDYKKYNRINKLSIKEYYYYHFDSCSEDFRSTFLPYSKAEDYWRILNPNKYSALARDKFLSHCILEKLGIPHSELICAYCDEIGRDGNGLFSNIDNITNALRNAQVDKFVVKPAADTSHGDGVRIYDKQQIKELSGGPISIADILVSSITLFERIVKQSEQMSSFNSSSVNTIRIVTALYPDKTVKIIGSFLKIGRAGSCIDNAGNGGNVDCGVNHENGELFNAIEFNSWDDIKSIKTHPDSNVKIDGTKIDNWDSIVTEVKSFQSRFHWLKCIGWDVAITEEGPVIIEINNWWDTTGQLFIGKGWHVEVKACYDAWVEYYKNKQ